MILDGIERAKTDLQETEKKKAEFIQLVEWLDLLGVFRKESDPMFQKSPAAEFSKEDLSFLRRLPSMIASVQKQKGPKGDPGQSIKGKDGDDGKTPVRGRDYFTDDDIQSFIKEVLARIRQPKDGKDALINYAQVIREVLARMPRAKDGKDADEKRIIETVLRKIPKPRDGEPGRDGVMDMDLLKKETERYLHRHEKECDHSLLHESSIIGSVRVDESEMAPGKTLIFDEETRMLKYAYPPRDFIQAPLPQDLHPESIPQFTGLRITGVSASRIIVTDENKRLRTSDYSFDDLLVIANTKYGIQPTEATDGARVAFTVPDGYVVGTLRVYMGSASGHMRLFGITATNGTTVTLPIAPLTEESLYFDYITP